MPQLIFPETKPDWYKGHVRFETIDEPDVAVETLNEIGAARRRVIHNSEIEEQIQTAQDENQDPSIIEGLRLQLQSSGTDLKQLQGEDPTLTARTRDERLEAVITKNATFTGDVVNMYLPQAIQMRDGVEYENVQLGIVGGAIARGLREGNNLVSAGLAGLADEGKSLIDGLKGGLASDMAKAATVRASKYFGETATNAVRSATQTSINPNTQSLFRQVNIREFAFTFKMIPDSQREANTIKKIVKFFRTELYPEEIEASGVSLAYKFPKKFDIQFLYDNKEVASRILPCFLKDVSVTFNPTAAAMHADGNFSETDISLTFTESRPLRKKEIQNLGY